jgi:ATP-dependent HslUV protease, peptidase subunit HslV
MSIAVAVRKDHEVILAADSQTNFGSSTVGAENHRARKIRRVGTAFVATTGWGLYDNILDHLLRSGTPPRLTNQDAIFEFFLKFWRALHDRYTLINDQADKDNDSPFGDLDASFLIVNRRGIYSVASDLSVTEFSQYYAIGSGSDFSLGALHALYDGPLDAAELARRACAAAIEFNIYCGGEVETVRCPIRERKSA